LLDLFNVCRINRPGSNRNLDPWQNTRSPALPRSTRYFPIVHAPSRLELLFCVLTASFDGPPFLSNQGLNQYCGLADMLSERNPDAAVRPAKFGPCWKCATISEQKRCSVRRLAARFRPTVPPPTSRAPSRGESNCSHERLHGQQTGKKQEHARSRGRANDLEPKAETPGATCDDLHADIHTSLA
jgi:hypothetical protein